MLCNKCRQCPPYGTDSWCLGCTATESLNTELSSRWSTAALRAVANDLVVGAVRGVSALRKISSGIHSAGQARAATTRADSARNSVAPAREADDRQRRERSRTPIQRVKAQEESSGEEGDEEEEEEEEPRRSKSLEGAAPKSNPGFRPPEPPFPPRGHHRQEHQSSHRRDHHPEEGRDRRRSGGKKKRGNRGGSKHPRLHRTLDDPGVRVHRKATQAFWESGRSLAGPSAPREHR